MAVAEISSTGDKIEDDVVVRLELSREEADVMTILLSVYSESMAEWAIDTDIDVEDLIHTVREAFEEAADY